MVKLLYIGLYRRGDTNGSNVVRLGYGCDLSQFGFFTRGKALQYLHFATETACQRALVGGLTIIPIKFEDDSTDTGYVLYSRMDSDGLACSLVTDQEYPRTTVHVVMREEMARYRGDQQAGHEHKHDGKAQEVASLSAVCTKKPQEIDKLERVSSQLDEVKEIMYKNIEAVLARGETLESLIERSRDLQESSKIFAKNARKLRIKYSCCRYL